MYPDDEDKELSLDELSALANTMQEANVFIAAVMQGEYGGIITKKELALSYRFKDAYKLIQTLWYVAPLLQEKINEAEAEQMYGKADELRQLADWFRLTVQLRPLEQLYTLAAERKRREQLKISDYTPDTSSVPADEIAELTKMFNLEGGEK